MFRTLLLAGITLTLAAGPVSGSAGDFDSLKPNQVMSSFQVEAVYENETGRAIGARFRHDRTGFVLDVLSVQSIPQGFMWVNSAPLSDQGEPHTLEHLLLGKGNRGRYVASLEDMSLGRSSAYTEQRRTCYHFSTEAGKDIFFKLFEAKLEAMISPDFSDEEIRREVCNMGIVENPDGTLGLEEKGTVYNEMVSSFERPWGNLYRALGQMLYGREHPLALSSGGFPAAIRTMTPEDLRHFHATTHHLNNMGAVLAVGDEIPLRESLETMSGILARVEPDGKVGEDPASLWTRLPAPQPAPAGGIARTHFPHQNPNEPGLMVFAWPAVRNLSAEDDYMMGVFLDVLASGETSNLYRKFIDSQTRVMDIGASSVFAFVDDEPGQPVYIGFGSVNPSSCTEESLREVRSLLRDEIRSVAELADGSEELRKFNERVLNHVTQDRRAWRRFLNSPPRFGYRGTGSAWLDRLQSLHRKGGFRRNLAGVDELAAVERAARGDVNVWKTRVAAWKLLDEPYAGATTADPEMIASEEAARVQRIRDYVDGLKAEFGVAQDAEAVALYRDRYNAGTEVIEAKAAGITMPGFVDNPPLSLDGQLKFATTRLKGGVPLVASTFDNMTGGTAGLAFNMNVVPASQEVYIAALPMLIRSIGVVEDGTAVPYDTFEESLRREILSLDVYYDVNYKTERVDLVLRGSGSDRPETLRALHWMNGVLLRSNLGADNLPRIRDAVDQALKSSRNRMRGSEESWVNTPANAFWKQHNPILLNAHCFLTQTHALHRLRWMLKETTDAAPFRAFLDRAVLAAGSGRTAFTAALTAVIDGTPGDLLDPASVDAATAELCVAAATDLRQSLSEIPDASLTGDVTYLCGRMHADLLRNPKDVLADIRALLSTIGRRDNARAFLVSSGEDREAVVPGIEAILDGLGTAPSVRRTIGNRPLITSSVNARGQATDGPVFVALVNENTRSGVHIHTTDCATYGTTDRDALLRFVSARLYGGGGAHSMFMKTWGAGLAYSNGLRSNEANGRILYYAERCPDLAQTLQFVVNELRNAPFDESLADYAVAQAFSGNRSGDRYELRGEAMASDLADGVTPAVVESFRKGILELRGDPGLYRKIHDLMPAVYGEVLPGYGVSAAEATRRGNAIYFVIGPDKQVTSWENHLKTVEPDARLVRMYPRDYWLTGEVSN